MTRNGTAILRLPDVCKLGSPTLAVRFDAAIRDRYGSRTLTLTAGYGDRFTFRRGRCKITKGPDQSAVDRLTRIQPVEHACVPLP